MNKKVISVLVIFTSFFASEVRAQSKKSEFSSFMGGPVLVLQSGGWLLSGEFDYTPRFFFGSSYYARLNLGAALFLGKGDNYFTALDAKGLFGMDLSQKFDLELGGGLQYWWGGGGFVPVLAANFAYKLPKKIWHIDRFVLGYTLGFATSWGTHEINIAAGLNFPVK